MTLVKWWADEKTLLRVGDEPIIYNMSGDPLIHVYKSADVERIVGTVLRHLLHHNHEGLAVCAVCQEAQCLLALLEGRDE